MDSDRVGRNWTVIAQVKNPFLRLAMATLERDDWALTMLIAAYPAFVTNDGKDIGAIPLSEILRRAAQNAMGPHGCGTTETSQRFPVSHHGADGLPVHGFYLQPDAAGEPGFEGLSFVPRRLADALFEAPFGTTFEWNGSKFVTLEWNDSNQIVYFVPAECILDDISEDAAQAEQRSRRSRELCGND